MRVSSFFCAAAVSAALVLASRPLPPAPAQPATITLNVSDLGAAYDGIGALSGGGGVTRLLMDYPAAQREDIWDILFKPHAGAALQIIKVEIAGDTQSTEGTELSHMHVRGDLNCSRGYEWAVLAAAKARNPAIKTYGLSWGVPGWIGDQHGGGMGFYSQDNIDYHLNWIDCAVNTWHVPIDYMGIFNERGAQPDWTIRLRQALDAAGYLNTRIVSADTDWNGPVNDMLANPAYAAAVDIVGAHYPGEPPAAAYSLNKTLWASEMWNLGKVDDWPGAQVLMSDLISQASWGISSSILWCLVYSWYAILPFSTVVPGSQAGAGHSILTAAEPWSGHYELNPTIHAMAHHTQFAAPGWRYLARGSPGMSALPGGGAMVARVNPHTPSSVLEFSATLHTAGAAASQDIIFALAGLAAGCAPPAALGVWMTNASAGFVRQADVPDAGGGTYALTLAPDAFYSLTSAPGAQGGPAPAAPNPPSAPFPFPYSDNFEGYAEQGYARYWSDEGGAFIVQPVPANFTPAPGAAPGGSAYFQLVTVVPIAWEKNPDPYTLLGDFNPGHWTDYTLSGDVAIDPSAALSGPIHAAVMQACGAGGGSVQTFTIASGAADLTEPSALESAAFPGLCLGVTGATLYPGAVDVGLQPCGAGAPLWQFNASGWAEVARVGTADCLDVLSANASSGARVDGYACKGARPDEPNQRWTPTYGPGASTVTLASQLATPSLCLGLEALPAPLGNPYVFIASRIGKYVRNGPPPSGYALRVGLSPNATTGAPWQLAFATTVLAHGTTPAPVVAGAFHTAAVTAKGSTISASWDGATLASVTDTSSAFGMVAMGGGWHEAWFDNAKIVAA